MKIADRLARTFVALACGVLPAASLEAPASAARAPTGAGASSELNRQLSFELCRAAARTAETRYRLPPGILLAIGQVESARPDAAGHRLSPWPWTVTAMGKGLYFETKAAAISWVREAEAAGVDSIDTGCLQVNLFFHPDAFESLDAAFDPQRNADYAGRFLRQLYSESGDWRTATGLYHSRTMTLSAPYQERVARALRDSDLPALSSFRQSTTLNKLADAWRSTLSTDDPPVVQMSSGWIALPSSGPQAHANSIRTVSKHGRLTDSK